MDQSNNKKIQYDSSTNQRLNNPSYAQYISENTIAPHNNIIATSQQQKYRAVLGLGPGRSGTKTLAELFASQYDVIHCEHEMIVPRIFPRATSGRIDVDAVEQQAKISSSSCIYELTNSNKQDESIKKGTWGADRRLEWDTPRLARGEPPYSDNDETIWRKLRLLEQRKVFEDWVNDYGSTTDDGDDVVRTANTLKKLGKRGWMEHNNYVTSKAYIIGNNKDDDTENEGQITLPTKLPVVAAVSSVGLAYIHEYIALDSSIKIVILLRPTEEVVSSFMMKSKGRNHWQKHLHKSKRDNSCDNEHEDRVQKDKTWDNAFPNMSDDECRLVMQDYHIEAAKTRQEKRPDKIWAIRAYCKVYEDVSNELKQRYPNNIKVYNMHSAFSDVLVQEDLLQWCGFNDVVLDTSTHLNKKK